MSDDQQQTPLTPEEAGAMLDAIDKRFQTQNRQILLLSLAVFALALSVTMIQWKLSHDGSAA